MNPRTYGQLISMTKEARLYNVGKTVSSTNGAGQSGQLLFKKNEIRTFFNTRPKNKLKWIKDLNVRWDTIKLLEENIGRALFIIFLLAVLGLRFCARAFSSCGKRGPLFIVVRGPLTYRGLSCCGAQAPDAQAQELWLTGLVAPWHVGSSQTRARTRVPCIGRQILNLCATREARQGTL